MMIQSWITLGTRTLMKMITTKQSDRYFEDNVIMYTTIDLKPIL